YAFDTPENTGLPNSNYQSVKYGDGNTVYVPYKAVVNGQTDNLKALIQGKETQVFLRYFFVSIKP
ncbi:MAG: hypothetical protein LBS01_02495, partial [Prevotellaceae bacterium]|nr:hypothetical protein [Prevotellaceae bacterium]